MASNGGNTTLFNLQSLKHAAYGSMSGIWVGLLLQPLEVIKTAFQINPHEQGIKMKSLHTNKSIYSTIKMIFKNEGIKGFFRGTVAATMRTGMAAGIYFYSLNI